MSPRYVARGEGNGSPLLIIAPTSALVPLFMRSIAISLSLAFKYLVLSGRSGSAKKVRTPRRRAGIP